ncbi:hypothetical protein E1264_37730 [Actinomadura sp. KC216]|uniref:hypothetical protein n=1 Tax=Actinomadura sp. KC216 TaxID=2530370 RepID=UPI001049997E|nr:hypothetical protein [Actinomadura sp. KC216]TDB77121.1 hypothetical protein E1264_37730 [Actinomadura sp. KC216]
MAAEEQPLPFRFNHPFQLWSYSNSHQKLALRGRPDEKYDRYVDVIFSYVLGMKVAASYHRLSVSISANVAEMDSFLQMPRRYDRGFLNLDVTDGIHEGFVVCGRVMVRRGVGWQSSTNER